MPKYKQEAEGRQGKYLGAEELKNADTAIHRIRADDTTG